MTLGKDPGLPEASTRMIGDVILGTNWESVVVNEMHCGPLDDVDLT